jgi:hypothetical protein
MTNLDTNQHSPLPAATPAPAERKKLGGARPNSGGARVGSGRPKTTPVQQVMAQIKSDMLERAVRDCKITPLEYMLRVLSGDHPDARGPADRQWAATAAAPYMHARLSQVNSTSEASIKVSAEEAAAVTRDIVGTLFGT